MPRLPPEIYLTKGKKKIIITEDARINAMPHWADVYVKMFLGENLFYSYPEYPSKQELENFVTYKPTEYHYILRKWYPTLPKGWKVGTQLVKKYFGNEGMFEDEYHYVPANLGITQNGYVSRAEVECNPDFFRHARKKMYKGVEFRKKDGLWVSRVRINKKQKTVGIYTTEIAAAYAYNKAITGKGLSMNEFIETEKELETILAESHCRVRVADRKSGYKYIYWNRTYQIWECVIRKKYMGQSVNIEDLLKYIQ